MPKVELTDRELSLVMGSLQGVIRINKTVGKLTGKDISSGAKKEEFEIMSLLIRLDDEFGEKP